MRWYWKVMIVLLVLGSCHSYSEAPSQVSNREKDIQALRRYLQQHEDALQKDIQALRNYDFEQSNSNLEKTVQTFKTYLQEHESALRQESSASSALRTYLWQLQLEDKSS